MEKSELVSADEYKSLEREYVQAVLPITVARHGELGERIGDIDREMLEAEVTLHRLKAEEHSSALMQLMGDLQTKTKQLIGQRAKLVHMRALVQASSDDLKVQFGLLWGIPRIRKVWVAYERLVYHTHPLFGKDHEKRWRRIGPFEISFDLRLPIRENFTWVNLDGRKDQWHGPPNIQEPNDAEYGVVSCAGDAQTVIDAANQTYDYVSLVAFSVRYPECAGATNNDTIKRWNTINPALVPRWYIEQFGA